MKLYVLSFYLQLCAKETKFIFWLFYIQKLYRILPQIANISVNGTAIANTFSDCDFLFQNNNRAYVHMLVADSMNTTGKQHTRAYSFVYPLE